VNTAPPLIPGGLNSANASPYTSSTLNKKKMQSGKFSETPIPIVITEEDDSDQNLSEQEAIEKDVIEFLR
jgi:hypothetical protein